MSAPHTPGPWGADFHNERMVGGRFVTIVSAPGQLVPIAAVTTGVEGYGRDEGRANARLIAAAPCLLGALEWIALIYESCDLNHAEFRVEAKRCVDAAIAKAKGEQA